MYTLLCYGDSNTYGYDPVTGGRHDYHVRWTGILQELFQDEYLVIEEGLCGRTINYTDPKEPYKNGMSTLNPILSTHKPVDILFFMLGTNDCNTACGYSPEEIAANMEMMILEAKAFLNRKQETEPLIILASPIQIGEDIDSSPFAKEVGMDGVLKSRKLPSLYRDIAQRQGSLFFNAGETFRPSKADSEHLNRTEHRRFAEKLYHLIREHEKDILRMNL